MAKTQVAFAIKESSYVSPIHSSIIAEIKAAIDGEAEQGEG